MTETQQAFGLIAASLVVVAMLAFGAGVVAGEALGVAHAHTAQCGGR